LFLPASKDLLLGISTGVFEQIKRACKWSESRALGTIARARVPSGRPTSHLGDRHLDLETDISSHTSRWCASRALQMDTDVSRMRGLNATNS
jgi:hypothetical protein